MPVPFRPLGLIKEMIEVSGLEVTYVYDDLVFIEHNAFLLQMGESGEDVAVWFNVESTQSSRPELLKRLQRAGTPLGLNMREGGNFRMQQEEGEENLQLEFL